MTELGLGTAQLGDLYTPIDQTEAEAIVAAAWDSGIRYFDTAPHYGLGTGERRLGLALAGQPRNEFTISSKVGRLIVEHEDGVAREWDFTEAGVTRSVEESLTRLGLNKLDIVLIHDPSAHLDEAITEAYPALHAMREAGLVDAIGVGTRDIDALIRFVQETDIDTVMVAGRQTLLGQPAARALLPLCERKGVAVLNVGVFNSGLLATDSPIAGARYDYAEAPGHLVERARKIAAVANRHGTSLPQAALAFAALPQSVASVVVGAESAAQIRRNAELFTRSAELDALWAELQAAGLIDQNPRDSSRGRINRE
ncbi:aldo/keto reductase (plasmid) [Coraliomargarita sp. W4R53]